MMEHHCQRWGQSRRAFWHSTTTDSQRMERQTYNILLTGSEVDYEEVADKAEQTPNCVLGTDSISIRLYCFIRSGELRNRSSRAVHQPSAQAQILFAKYLFLYSAESLWSRATSLEYSRSCLSGSFERGKVVSCQRSDGQATRPLFEAARPIVSP